MNRFLIALPLLLIFGLSIILYIGLQKNPANIDTGIVGKALPPITLKDQKGRPIDLTDYAQTHEIFFINFFASWCPPCKIEHPQLMRLADQKKIPILGIAYKDEIPQTNEFLFDYGSPYQKLAHDPKGRAAIDFGLVGVPETYLIKKGQIIFHFAGPITPSLYETLLLEELKKASDD